MTAGGGPPPQAHLGPRHRCSPLLTGPSPLQLGDSVHGVSGSQGRASSRQRPSARPALPAHRPCVP